MADESSYDNAPDLSSRHDDSEEEDIYAQLARLDESLNNELEDLKRIMVLSQESSREEGDANEVDDLDVNDGNCSNDDEIDVQPQLQTADEQVESNLTETTGKSKGNRLQRNPQRGKRNNTRSSNGKQQNPTTSEKKNNRKHRKQHQDSRAKQPAGVGNEVVEKKDNAGSSSTAKKRAGTLSAANKNADSSSTVKEREESSSDANRNTDSSSTPTNTQPKRMEGRGRGFRRRQATLRQEQAKQPNNNNNKVNYNEATTKETPAVETEGKGRRARARRGRIRREQQQVNNEGRAAEPRKKDNLSTEQKQRIIDSLNQGRNNFLSR